MDFNSFFTAFLAIVSMIRPSQLHGGWNSAVQKACVDFWTALTVDYSRKKIRLALIELVKQWQ